MVLRSESGLAEVEQRHTEMLRVALGPVVDAARSDPDVLEISLNPDGRLWLDTSSRGLVPAEAKLRSDDAERAIRLIASWLNYEVHAQAPTLSAEIPISGERFQGFLPPVVTAPTFSIRKHASRVYPLERYVADGIMLPSHADFLREAVRDRLNIVIAGATSSGKTTLANALLDEVARTDDRVLILEDTVELQCAAANYVQLRTVPGIVSMAELVRATMRMRPDRIIVGEVRGGEALDLLKAWGTGHPGGIATLHAGSALEALSRLEHLIQEVVVRVPRALIAQGVDIIVFIAGRGRDRKVHEIVRVTGHSGRAYTVESIHPRLEPAMMPSQPDAMSRHRVPVGVLIFLLLVFWPILPAIAGGTGGGGLPWETPLNTIKDSLTGPVAMTVAIIIIVGCGLTMAISDVQGGMKKLLQAAFGISLALAASTAVTKLVSDAQGALLQ